METQVATAAIAVANPEIHDHRHWLAEIRDLPVARRVMLEVGMRACLRLVEHLPAVDRPAAAIALAAVQVGISAGAIPTFPCGIPSWRTEGGHENGGRINHARAAITRFCRFAASAPPSEPLGRWCRAQFMGVLDAAVACDATLPENSWRAAPAAPAIQQQRQDCLSALREH